MLADRIARLIPEYQKMFAERGGVTPTDPLEFHFYHLARYWSRLIGFSRNFGIDPESFLSSDIAACVQVATDSADRIIGPESPIHCSWRSYRSKLDGLFIIGQSVSVADIEETSSAFDGCLAALKFDPWAK